MPNCKIRFTCFLVAFLLLLSRQIYSAQQLIGDGKTTPFKVESIKINANFTAKKDAPYANKATMVADTLSEGRTYSTQGYYKAGDGGGGEYLIKTLVNFGGTPDGYVNHAVNGGTHVAVLQTNGCINSLQAGVIGGINEKNKVQAVVNVVPNGGTIEFSKYLNKLVFSGITCTGKSLTIDLGGNIVSPAANEYIFNFAGGFNSIRAVSSLSTITDTVKRTVLAVADTSNYSVGDVVKVVSTDDIPHGWTAGRYVGEYAVVQDVSQNVSITLQSKLFDHEIFATAIKVAILDDVTFTIKNGIISNNPAYSAGGLIIFNSAKNCYLENITTYNINNSFFASVNLYRYTARNITVLNSLNDPDNGKYGYGVIDTGSYGGVIESIYGFKCRHVVTTGAPDTAGNDGMLSGRTIFLRVVGGIGRDAEAGAWDTHPGAAYVTYENCMAYGGSSFGQSRSPYTRFVNPYGRDLKRGIKFGVPKFGVQSLLGEEIINPDLEVTETLIELYTPPASTATITVPAEISVRGGKMRVDNTSATRGFVVLARGQSSNITIKDVDIIVDNQSTNPAIFIHPNNLTRCLVSDTDIYFGASTFAGYQWLVSADGAAGALATEVWVLNTTLRGPGTSRLAAIIGNSDGWINNVKSELISDTFSAIKGTNATIGTWGY